MRTINKLNLDPVATFPQIAKELGETGVLKNAEVIK